MKTMAGRVVQIERITLRAFLCCSPNPPMDQVPLKDPHGVAQTRRGGPPSIPLRNFSDVVLLAVQSRLT